MAINPVSSGGPPGGFASLLPLPARQSAPAAGETAPAGSVTDPGQAAAVRTEAPNSVSSTSPSQPSAIGKTEIEDAVAKVQKVVANQANNLLFSIDEDSGRTVVKVVDSSTMEMIRQIPSEEILSIAKALDKLQGLLLKQTA